MSEEKGPPSLLDIFFAMASVSTLLLPDTATLSMVPVLWAGLYLRAAAISSAILAAFALIWRRSSASDSELS